MCLTHTHILRADLQRVDIGRRVLTRPDPARLPEIYRKLGMGYDDKVGAARLCCKLRCGRR